MKQFLLYLSGLFLTLNMACAEKKLAQPKVMNTSVPAAVATPCTDPAKANPIPEPTKEFSLLDKDKDTGCKLGK
jgi:hypothetical protein